MKVTTLRERSVIFAVFDWSFLCSLLLSFASNNKTIELNWSKRICRYLPCWSWKNILTLSLFDMFELAFYFAEHRVPMQCRAKSEMFSKQIYILRTVTALTWNGGSRRTSLLVLLVTRRLINLYNYYTFICLAYTYI